MKQYFTAIRNQESQANINKYFDILAEFEDIDNLSMSDFKRFQKTQLGGSDNLLQSLLVGSMSFLGFRALTDGQKSKSKIDENKAKIAYELKM